MASEVITARERSANVINAISSRTMAFGSTREAAVNRRAASLARKYASWDNPLRASDWEINNAYRIGKAVKNILG